MKSSVDANPGIDADDGFGGKGRFNSGTVCGYGLESPPAWVVKFLESYEPDLRERIDRAVKQWNLILRDHVRTETGLRLIVGDEAKAVPVRVMDGLPQPFFAITQGQLRALWSLLLHKRLLMDASRGLEVLREELDTICCCLNVELYTGPHEIDQVHDFVQAVTHSLEHADLVDRLRGINQDVLGAYFFRIPQINLYWMPIGLVARVLGVSADAVAVVVLAHELAHAYTHLGRDIDGRDWETEAFARTSCSIVEGVAQFYTQVLCDRLRSRFPDSERAYTALLSIQNGPYLVHKDWPSDGQVGEAVRFAMIDTRRTRNSHYGVFMEQLGQFHSKVRGR